MQVCSGELGRLTRLATCTHRCSRYLFFVQLFKCSCSCCWESNLDPQTAHL
jgi:hypothetical protein